MTDPFFELKLAVIGAGLLLVAPLTLPAEGAGGIAVIVTAPVRLAAPILLK